MKKWILRLFIALGSLALAIVAAALMVDGARANAALTGAPLSSRVLLDHPMEFNFRQSTNSCGPYSTAAALRVLGVRDIDSETVAKSITWRQPNGPTLPWGISAYLENAGFSAESYDSGRLSDEDRVTFLREHIAAGHPVIILGGTGKNFRLQHYVTVVGFDSDLGEFYIYDSAHTRSTELDSMTIDDNGNPPGNRTLTNQELLDFWNDGGVYGLYNHHAIVASK